MPVPGKVTGFPNGVSSYGVPVVPDTYYRKVLWVGNATGLPVGDGSSPDYPLSSLFGSGGALAKADPLNLGTLIRVHRNHAENISAADHASATSALKNITIVGEGPCQLMPKFDGSRPTLTWSAAAATWLFDTVGIRLVNLNLYMAGALASVTALTIAAPITVSSEGCGVYCCYVNAGIDADQLTTIGITTTAAADGFQLIGNTVRGGSLAVTQTTFLRLVGLDDCEIAYNDIVTGTSAAAVGPIQALTTAPVNVNIHHNYVQNIAASSTACITGMAGMTGWISDNRLRNMTDASNAQIPTPGNTQLFENYGVNNNGESGIIIGTPSV